MPSAVEERRNKKDRKYRIAVIPGDGIGQEVSLKACVYLRSPRDNTASRSTWTILILPPATTI